MKEDLESLLRDFTEAVKKYKVKRGVFEEELAQLYFEANEKGERAKLPPEYIFQVLGEHPKGIKERKPYELIQISKFKGLIIGKGQPVPEEFANLTYEMHSKGKSPREIYELLKEHGIKISESTVRLYSTKPFREAREYRKRFYKPSGKGRWTIPQEIRNYIKERWKAELLPPGKNKASKEEVEFADRFAKEVKEKFGQYISSGAVYIHGKYPDEIGTYRKHVAEYRWGKVALLKYEKKEIISDEEKIANKINTEIRRIHADLEQKNVPELLKHIESLKNYGEKIPDYVLEEIDRMKVTGIQNGFIKSVYDFLKKYEMVSKVPKETLRNAIIEIIEKLYDEGIIVTGRGDIVNGLVVFKDWDEVNTSSLRVEILRYVKKGVIDKIDRVYAPKGKEPFDKEGFEKIPYGELRENLLKALEVLGKPSKTTEVWGFLKKIGINYRRGQVSSSLREAYKKGIIDSNKISPKYREYFIKEKIPPVVVKEPVKAIEEKIAFGELIDKESFKNYVNIAKLTGDMIISAEDLPLVNSRYRPIILSKDDKTLREEMESYAMENFGHELGVHIVGPKRFKIFKEVKDS